jgi:hypothetical protein
VEVSDYWSGFASETGVLHDRVEKVFRSPVMEEENALAKSPQGRGAKFIGPSSSLNDAIS